MPQESQATLLRPDVAGIVGASVITNAMVSYGSHPNVGKVSHISNSPQNDSGNNLGLCIVSQGWAFFGTPFLSAGRALRARAEKAAELRQETRPDERPGLIPRLGAKRPHKWYMAKATHHTVYSI